MVTLHEDYDLLEHMQSVIVNAVHVVSFVFSVCCDEFFLQNQHVFIVKVYYQSRSYKFVRKQFIAEFKELGTTYPVVN